MLLSASIGTTKWMFTETPLTPPTPNGHRGTLFRRATRALVADIITSKLRDLDLKFPEVGEAHLKTLAEARKMLEDE